MVLSATTIARGTDVLPPLHLTRATARQLVARLLYFLRVGSVDLLYLISELNPLLTALYKFWAILPKNLKMIW